LVAVITSIVAVAGMADAEVVHPSLGLNRVRLVAVPLVTVGVVTVGVFTVGEVSVAPEPIDAAPVMLGAVIVGVLIVGEVRVRAARVLDHFTPAVWDASVTSTAFTEALPVGVTLTGTPLALPAAIVPLAVYTAELRVDAGRD
jgi:hypothetical protein